MFVLVLEIKIVLFHTSISILAVLKSIKKDKGLTNPVKIKALHGPFYNLSQKADILTCQWELYLSSEMLYSFEYYVQPQWISPFNYKQRCTPYKKQATIVKPPYDIKLVIILYVWHKFS